MSSESNQGELAVANKSTQTELQATSHNAAQAAGQDVEGDTKPKKSLLYSNTESIFRIVIVLLLGIFLLFFAYVLGMWTSEQGGMWIPLFNVELFNPGNLGFLIIIWTVAAIVAEVIKMVIGRYIMTFAVTSLVGNLIILITVAILFFQRNIMNPEFFVRLGEPFEGNVPAFIQFVLGNANVIVVVVVAIILIVETIKTWVKAVKYS